jgi:NAD(P)-dependent dehydrogenase (short-subunit alcohol dehydrogenase family)
MIQMTRYLAVFGGTSNVRVNAVLPGFIVQDEHRSRFDHRDNERYRHIAEFSHPARRTGTSNDVANACLFLCSQESAFVTGQCLVVDGGSTIQEHFSLLRDFDTRHAH